MFKILKSMFKQKTAEQLYDMNSLAGIKAIPVPAKNGSSGDSLKDATYYVLQRKATEHKRAGQMKLAIECLRKSIALSDYEPTPLLLEKDYMRLPKYLKLSGDLIGAEESLNQILSRHPSFLDKRISNKERISIVIAKCKKDNCDLVYITSSSNCPECSPYNNAIYSISGKSKKYPALPDIIRKNGGPCASHLIGILPYYDL